MSATTTSERTEPVSVHGEPAADMSRTEGRAAGTPVGTGLTGGLVLLIVGVAVVFVVTAQNTRSVRFDFLWLSGDAPLAVLLLAAVLLTLVVDEAVGLVWRRRRRAVQRMRETRPGRRS